MKKENLQDMSCRVNIVRTAYANGDLVSREEVYAMFNFLPTAVISHLVNETGGFTRYSKGRKVYYSFPKCPIYMGRINSAYELAHKDYHRHYDKHKLNIKNAIALLTKNGYNVSK